MRYGTSLFNYRWELADGYNSLIVPQHKKKVYSCFACCGGSTMGYKLAGYDVIGCNELDPRMMEIYVNNHHPRIAHTCDIREMITADLPEEMFNLDVLDGSPPCTSFSMCGIREKGWGERKEV